MNFFSYGIPIGRYFGINVRLHFTFLLYAYYRVQAYQNPFFGLLFVSAIYLCILLHEFGHALAARWCDGEANDILLWPLGGLAFVRPAWNPTAHLITTVAGPFVTFVLWVGLAVAARLLPHGVLFAELSTFNGFILLFNLIPAFPVDGGRILRDTLWHWMRAETATRIAVIVSRVIAALGAVLALVIHDYWLLVFPVFIFMQTMHEQQIVAMESRGAVYGFSIRDRLKRGRKQREFRRAVRESVHIETASTFHRCAVCGLTEITAPAMDFRVCPDCASGHEYCREHLDAHPHS